MEFMRYCSGSEELSPDTEFVPNVLNTVVFLLDIIMQLFVFIVNYQVRVWVWVDGRDIPSCRAFERTSRFSMRSASHSPSSSCWLWRSFLH